MDFKSLRYILTMSENGGVSEAAKALGISQPSLSKYLRNLSESLGVQLFEHVGGRLRPTYAGERYISYAQQALLLTDEFYHLGDSPPDTKSLRVACPAFGGSYIHPFAISQFRKICPNTKLTIVESTDASLLLLSGDADMAIANRNLNNPELVHETIACEEVLLVTGKRHPIAKQALWREGCRFPWVDLGGLRNEVFIQLVPRHSACVKADELMERLQMRPHVLMQTHSILTAIRLAATGTGFCLAPETSVRHFEFSELPAYYSVGEPLLLDIYAVYNHRSPLSQEAECFVRLVSDFLV